MVFVVGIGLSDLVFFFCCGFLGLEFFLYKIENAAEKLLFFIPNWTLMYIVNAFVVIWVLVVGQHDKLQYAG